MKSNRIRNLIMGALTTVVFMIGIGTVTQADAQTVVIRRPRVVIRTHRPIWNPHWDRTITIVDPIAEEREDGYKDGLEAGKYDAKEDRDFDPENHKKFRKSDSYAYRRAFVRGYENGFRRESHKD